MKLAILAIATLALAGCDMLQGPSKHEAAQPTTIQTGKWQAILAQTPYDPLLQGIPKPAIWRLDTTTGELSYCFYAKEQSRCDVIDSPKSLTYDPTTGSFNKN